MKLKNANDYLNEIQDLQRCHRNCICKAAKYFDKIMTHCPSHDDRVPSLSVKADTGKNRPLLHCFAGCDYKDISQAFKTWGIW